jgi:hypothetical protein
VNNCCVFSLQNFGGFTAIAIMTRRSQATNNLSSRFSVDRQNIFLRWTQFRNVQKNSIILLLELSSSNIIISHIIINQYTEWNSFPTSTCTCNIRKVIWAEHRYARNCQQNYHGHLQTMAQWITTDYSPTRRACRLNIRKRQNLNSSTSITKLITSHLFKLDAKPTYFLFHPL